MLKVINILIDVLEFVSFWMVAPELLGEKRMKTIETAVRKTEPYMPGILVGASGTIIGLTFSFLGIYMASTQYLMQWNIFLAVFMVIYILTILKYSKRFSAFLSNDFFGPFFQKLSDSEVFRKNALKLGAVLFTLSFVLKMVVDILS
jgi:carbon starvation protein CstA